MALDSTRRSGLDGLLRFVRNDGEGAGKSRYTTTLSRFAARVMPV
ncbi:hypothetical protein ABIE49_002795 [Bradyrhizobium sp. OAE829]